MSVAGRPDAEGQPGTGGKPGAVAQPSSGRQPNAPGTAGPALHAGWIRRRLRALEQEIGPGELVCALPLTRVLIVIVAVLYSLCAGAVFAGFGMLLWFHLAEGFSAPPLLLVMAVLLVLFYLCLFVLLIWSWRRYLLVTTAGLEVVEGFRTVRARWADVARIEAAQSGLHLGSAVVVLRDGRRITSTVTGARFAMVNGTRVREHWPRILPDGSRVYAGPAVDVLINAHRRSLGL